MNAITKHEGMDLVEQVVMQGDLKLLSAKDRLAYYAQVCTSVGINPLTKPFDYLNLNGKLVLYANRNAAEQIRRVHGVSIKIVAREKVDDLYIVSAQATDKTGRSDEAIGAVNLSGLKGEALANATMKAETKAKRRVTLSLCGLGMLDETEVVTIPGARAIKVDPNTGEILEPVTSIHKPTDGAEERVSEPRRRIVQAVAEAMQMYLDRDDVKAAVAEGKSANLDAEEMIYLWTFFDSKARSAMKKEAKAQREAEDVGQPPEAPADAATAVVDSQDEELKGVETGEADWIAQIDEFATVEALSAWQESKVPEAVRKAPAFLKAVLRRANQIQKEKK